LQQHTHPHIHALDKLRPPHPTPPPPTPTPPHPNPPTPPPPSHPPPIRTVVTNLAGLLPLPFLFLLPEQVPIVWWGFVPSLRMCQYVSHRHTYTALSLPSVCVSMYHTDTHTQPVPSLQYVSVCITQTHIHSLSLPSVCISMYHTDTHTQLCPFPPYVSVCITQTHIHSFVPSLRMYQYVSHRHTYTACPFPPTQLGPFPPVSIILYEYIIHVYSIYV
jgi:hypothetical protein